MKRDRALGLARRMLHLLDTGTTELAPATLERNIEAFTSPEIFARERSEIFGKTPMFIGFSSELPKAGSYFTRDIVDTPYLALRDKAGQARLFLNACRHRGVKVALAPCGKAPRHVCRFHSWTYDLDGKLIGLPEPEGFDDMDRTARGLVELPCEEKYGMIFGCATPGADFDIDEALGGLGPELAEWGFDKYAVLGQPHVHQVNGNWKFAWDTFCENYHFRSLHGGTLGPLLHSERMAFDTFGRNVRVISAWKSIDEMRKAPEEEWDPIANLSIQYRLYPSVNFTVLPGFMAVYWIMPGRAPNHAEGLHITYAADVPEDEAGRTALDERIRFGCEDVVENEDFWITSQAEPGMRAPGTPETFVFGRNEPALQHFHRLYAEAAEGVDEGYGASLIGHNRKAHVDAAN